MGHVAIDVFFLEASSRKGGYRIYRVGSGGVTSEEGVHHPWFTAYPVELDEAGIVAGLDEFGDRIYDVEVIEEDAVPIVLKDSFVSPDYSRKVVKIYTKKKEYVRGIATYIHNRGTPVGLANIKYQVRVAMDLNESRGLGLFHEESPLLFSPLKDLEALMEETIERSMKLRVMSFDIEVFSRGSRFPKPGDPILSIQYGTVELGDDGFYDRRWIRDNVSVLLARRADEGESEALVEEFMKEVERSRPDILVGYNSVAFDTKYMAPFQPKAYMILPNFFVEVTGPKAWPHLDLFAIRTSMGSSLGIRSQKIAALDDVAYAVAADVKELSWLWDSPYMEAEARLDHSKIAEEWRKGSKLFFYYVKADAYLSLVIAKLWLPTLSLLSALTQIPLTSFNNINTGQMSEYVILEYLRRLGYYADMRSRTLEFRKVGERYLKNLMELIKRVLSGAGDRVAEWVDPYIFLRGKVYAKSVGEFRNIIEGDFSQLYPTIMATLAVDPIGLRVKAVARTGEKGVKSKNYADSLFGYAYNKTYIIPPTRLAQERSFVTVLGRKPSKSADYMEPVEAYLVVPAYGPVSWLFYKMFTARTITKKLKKRAKEEGRPELAAPDQAVKILNNSAYGGQSKRRGFINQVAASYIFWISMAIIYDVITYLESKGVEIVYSDTDSVFVVCNTGEAQKLAPGKDVREACTEWFEKILEDVHRYIRSKYGKDFSIKIEDRFDYCFFPKAKHGLGPSKKSYICGDIVNGVYRVRVIKGDFFKTVAPQAVKEDLESFYEKIINAGATTPEQVSSILKQFLKNAPTPKLFVKATVDSFISESRTGELVVERRGEEYVNVMYETAIKDLNKPWHFAALHLASHLGMEGARKVSSKPLPGGATYTVFVADAEAVLSGGSIVVYYIPETPRSFYIYIGDSEDGGVVLHHVKVKEYSKIRDERSDDAEDEKVVYVREKGYIVKEVWKEVKLSREELVDLVVKSMRKFIVSDVVEKLGPAITRSRRSLDAFLKPAG